MSDVVFDSSVVLAWLLHEPGAETLLELIPDAFLSSVNAAEVQSRLVRRGIEPKAAWESIIASVQELIPFDATLAEIAGTLVLQTKPFGLSLGDRACLALAKTMGVPAYTADRAWAELEVGVDVRLVR
jgi:ribonuclease VapC